MNTSSDASLPTTPYLVGGVGIAIVSLVMKTTSLGHTFSVLLDRAWTSATYRLLGLCGIPVIRFDTSLGGPGATQVGVEHTFFPLLIGLTIPLMLPLSSKLKARYALLGFLAGGVIQCLHIAFAFLVALNSRSLGLMFEKWIWPLIVTALILNFFARQVIKQEQPPEVVGLSS